MAKRDKNGGEPSVVEDQGLHASSCGYCKSDAKTSVSYGLWAHSLSVYDYQDLLNRGWRRSGMFLYKPDMRRTCCPAYTIRLKVDSFAPSKEQNRVMRKMQRYLDGTYKGPLSDEKEDLDVCEQQSSTQVDSLIVDESGKMGFPEMNFDRMFKLSNTTGESIDTTDSAKDLRDAIQDAITSCSLSGYFPIDLEIPKIVVQTLKPNIRKRIKTLSTGETVYSCNISFSVAAALSKHNEMEPIIRALEESGVFLETHNNGSRKVCPHQLAELLASRLQNKVELLGFSVEPCNGHLNFLLKNPANLDVRNADDMHPSKRVERHVTCGIKSGESCASPPLTRLLKPRRTLEVRLRRSSFDPEEFALYKRYQIAVHHDKPDDVKESSFVRFLVNSPLTFVPPSRSGTAFGGFGSFHQQYLIDGHLIAVGVVDILPSCLSSKYLFWDPDLAFLSLGKYSALQEIQWVRGANTVCPSLEHYYLGYYIHTCPKMRYKGAYQPSELLCPVNFRWVPFDVAEPLLNKQPFVCLSDHFDATVSQTVMSVRKEGINSDSKKTKIEENMTLDASNELGAASSSKESEDVNNILLKLGNQFLQFKRLQTWTFVPQKFKDALASDLRRYSQAVGHILASKMAYVLD